MAETVAHRLVRPISIARHPIYAMFLPVAVVCFVGALITDLAYARSGGTLEWLNLSNWLIATGLAFGAISAVLLLIDTIRGVWGWAPFGLLVVVWVVEFVNSLVHSRDGWTAVVPLGLILSMVGAALILVVGWLSRRVVESAR